MKDFFTELQSLGEPAKSKILIIATVIIMIVVIYFWLAYFNSIIAGVSAPSVADTGGAAQQGLAPTAQEDAGPWVIMMRAPAFLYDQFMNAAQGLANVLQAPRQYVVQPPR
jgi:hypothetical protein